MRAEIDIKNKIIDFYSDVDLKEESFKDAWICGMSYEDTALFIADLTKLLSEVKK